MTAVSLPVEIVESIIRQVSDTPTLLCCATVSRFCCALIQAQIFRYIGRDPPPYSVDSYQSRMEEFVTVITKPSSSHLRELVRAVRLKDVLLRNPDATIFEALLLLPNIDTLILSCTDQNPFVWSHLPPSVRSSLENTIFPRLHSLTMRRVLEVPFSKFFELCPKLETLEVVMCNLQPYGYMTINCRGRPYSESGGAPLALSLRHLKLWGLSLVNLTHNPAWLVLNTGFIKSLTIGRNILDHMIGSGVETWELILFKNRGSLEIVKILNYSAFEDPTYLNSLFILSNLKLLVLHMHWRMFDRSWQTTHFLQQVSKVLMELPFTIPTLHLLLSDILSNFYTDTDEESNNNDDNQSGTSSQEIWAPLDTAIRARPEMKLVLSVRETQDETFSFDEIKSYFLAALPQSSQGGQLDIGQYDGPLGGRWDLADEGDEQNEEWQVIG
ncbi:hypothetical protein DL96DRAFT_1590207 [Flagelloscypha sp. PMI_526]|nr:hypothetical protein DL96DRAFT_1590207 [Flagelloscypha sp. PMI_526]